MKDFFGLKSIEEVKKAYPNTTEGREAFIKAFQDKCNEETVGQILSEIFDFPYKDGTSTEKDSPRIQENLHSLTRRCTKMCLGSFPQIEEKLDEMTLGMSLESKVINKEIHFKGSESETKTTWGTKAELQDWDSVFPLDVAKVLAALNRTKEDCLEANIDQKGKTIQFINKAMRDVGLKFSLKSGEDINNVTNYSPDSVISGVITSLERSGLPLVSKHNLQCLFQEKDQELGQVQAATKSRGGR